MVLLFNYYEVFTSISFDLNVKIVKLVLTYRRC